MIDYSYHSFSFHSHFRSAWPVFLALHIFENVANGFVSWVSVSIHIVRHLTTSGDWSNSYHPIELSVCSFSLAVALWFPTYVSVPVAFRLKDQLLCRHLSAVISCVLLKLSIINSVTIGEMKGTEAPTISIKKIALSDIIIKSLKYLNFPVLFILSLGIQQSLMIDGNEHTDNISRSLHVLKDDVWKRTEL